jgi:hypothetical protein
LTASTGPGTLPLTVINGEGRDTVAHDVRPSTLLRRSEAARKDRRDDPAELVERHLPNATAFITDAQGHRIAETDLLRSELSGEMEDARHFLVYVPSNSLPGQAWRVRFEFHRPGPGAPYGWVTAVHDRHGCPAHDANRYCWHLDCGLAAIVRDFRHLLPNGGRIGERERPVRAAKVPEGEPEPRIPKAATAGFYD